MSPTTQYSAGHGSPGYIRNSVLLRVLGLLAAWTLGLSVAHGSESLTYDANGNVQTRVLPGGTTTFGYDDVDRVISEAGPTKTQSLTYDLNGNRTVDGTGNKTYATNSDRIATENGQSVTLDAVGNVTQARGFTYTWNQRAGQIKTVSQGATLLATYYYDYQGRRTRKVKAGAGSLAYRTTIYVYDRYDRLIVELNGAGTPQRTYVWRDDLPISIILHGATESVLYLETDHLGTPIAASNQAGTVVWKWESDAFGSTPPNEDPDGDGIATTINLRFPGMYYDAESGLMYNWHRYYDPKLGRYLSPDPVGLAGGRNLFLYARANPLNRIDPLGLTDLYYNNNAGTLTITDSNGNVVGTYPAANNAQSSSRGSWPDGTYDYSYHTTHSDDAPNSPYGSYGNYIFNVPGCTGCGVHSGRANSTDRAGRSGTGYATNGCIRTTDEATKKIQQMIQGGDPLQTLRVTR